MLGDTEALRSGFGRSGYDYVTVLLTNPDARSAFTGALATNPGLNVRVRSDAELREEQAQELSGIVYFVGYFVGSIMGLGAASAALNCFYLLSRSRARELATLRALGFSSSLLRVSMLIEAMILAVLGTILGLLGPWVLLNGDEVAFVGLDFSLAVTSQVAITGVGWALLIALIGGAIPAVSATRIPVVIGLRT